MRSRVLPRAAFAAALAAAALAPGVALAAAPYAARGLTLPRQDWSLNLGVGVAHDAPPPARSSRAGAGFSVDVGWSPATDFELGLRLGARAADAPGRALQPDRAARAFDTETYGGRGDPFANPELRFRWRFLNAQVAELGLETRFVLPVEAGSNLTLLPAVPMAFHFGNWVRLDTGLYVPLTFDAPLASVLSVPVRLWIHPDPRWCLGPISAIRLKNPGSDVDFLLGFGANWQVAPAVDLRLQALFPRISDTEGARNLLVGFGAEIHLE